MMNQKEGVFAAVVAVLGPINNRIVLDVVTEKQVEDIEALVVHGLVNGEIKYKDFIPDYETAKKYVGGLVNNWMRKDTRMTNGVAYVAKKPGSRTGAGDEQLAALKGLLALTTNPKERADIQESITARTNELAAAKIKPINVAALPAHLQHLAIGLPTK